MAFMDEFSKRLSQTGQSAVQKAKDMADISRLNTLISDEERTINNCYLQLGKAYAEKYGDGCDEEFSPKIEMIKDSAKKIVAYQAQIHEIKGLVCCSNCKKWVDKNVAFCNFCGSAIEVQIPDGKIRCSNCGGMMDKSMAFCTFSMPLPQSLIEISRILSSRILILMLTRPISSG